MATSPSRPLDNLFDPVYTSSKSPMIRMAAGKGFATQVGQGSPVTGASRTKFFSRPLGDVLEPFSPDVHLDTRSPQQTAQRATGRRSMAPARTALFAAEPQTADAKRTVGVQTMYRESEAQTDPYTPDFVIPAGASESEAAEILSLRHMTFANGCLPAGVNEVKEIVKIREAKAFEASLPSGTDEESLAIRKHMLEKKEMAELQSREAAIDALATAKLDELRETMHIRQEQRAMLAEMRIESVHATHAEAREDKFASVQAGRVKQLRKMVRARAKAEDRLNRSVSVTANTGRFGRDIIGEYTDFGSSIYAPLRRMGATLASSAAVASPAETQALPPLGGGRTSPKRGGGGGLVANDSDAMLESLRAIEGSLPTGKVGRRTLKGGQETLGASSKKGGGFVSSSGTGGREARRQGKIVAQLELMQRTITAQRASAAKASGGASPTTRTSSSKFGGAAADAEEADDAAVSMLKRPPVPDVAFDDADAESESAARRRIALTLVQSLIRGRAVQNLMYEGKEHRVGLIRELRLNEPDAESLQREVWIADDEDAKDSRNDLGASAADPFGTELEGLQAEAIAAVLNRLADAAQNEDARNDAALKMAAAIAEEGGGGAEPPTTVSDEVDNVLESVIGK